MNSIVIEEAVRINDYMIVEEKVSTIVSLADKMSNIYKLFPFFNIIDKKYSTSGILNEIGVLVRIRTTIVPNKEVFEEFLNIKERLTIGL
jgi:hypothetical protein